MNRIPKKMNESFSIGVLPTHIRAVERSGTDALSSWLLQRSNAFIRKVSHGTLFIFTTPVLPIKSKPIQKPPLCLRLTLWTKCYTCPVPNLVSWRMQISTLKTLSAQTAPSQLSFSSSCPSNAAAAPGSKAAMLAEVRSPEYCQERFI